MKSNAMENKYGSAPIYFMDESKQKEWDELSDSNKSFIMKYLHEVTSKMSHDIALETLCHIINDMNTRLEKLEGLKDIVSISDSE